MHKNDYNNHLLSEPKSIPAVILAGGQSRRLRLNNQYKWQLPFSANGTLLNYIIDKISKQSKHVLISAPYIDSGIVDRPTNNAIYNDLSTYSLPLFHDISPNLQGPLAGLISSLQWAKDQGHPWVMTLACDTPFFPNDLLLQLFKQAQRLDENNANAKKLAVTVSSHGRIHPIFGLWSTKLLSRLQHQLQKNSNNKRLLSISLWAQRYAAIIEIKPTPNNGEPFFNINTPDDYQKALVMTKTDVNLIQPIV